MARRADFYLGVLVQMYFSVGREVIKVQPEKYLHSDNNNISIFGAFDVYQFQAKE